VPIEKLQVNDLNLAAGRYKPAIVTTTNHHHPADILTEVLTTEETIVKQVKRLLAEVEK